MIITAIQAQTFILFMLSSVALVVVAFTVSVVYEFIDTLNSKTKTEINNVWDAQRQWSKALHEAHMFDREFSLIPYMCTKME